ncbi:hypothetical protein EJD97_020499 [Solanum chilense]|uniref:Putative plant transposon protein domain-containing protein n=1 Tax=Solanum chilense TaxID=4083 RepID=A0A6N2C670_SOLCI|nr:hypothetical protein EJD97_020499 [Solanum chilense]
MASSIAYLGCIVDGTQLNIGMIISQEMVMRAKHRQNSLLFSMLITELCRRAQMPRDEKRPSGTSNVAPSVTPSTSTSPLPPRFGISATQPPLTKVILLWMGHLAHSVDQGAARIKVIILSMILIALVDVVSPLNSTIDALAMRIRSKIPNVPDVSVMPSTTTRDDNRVEKVDDPKSKAETDVEKLNVDDEASLEGLIEVEEAMVDAVVQISLGDTPMADPTGPIAADMNPDIDSQA